MSYILDALRKAEAERERGQVPGLHSPTAAPTPVTAPPAGPPGPGPGRQPAAAAAWPPLAWAALLLAALGLGAAATAWWLRSTGDAAPPPAWAQPQTAMAQPPAAMATQPTTPAASLAPPHGEAVAPAPRAPAPVPAAVAAAPAQPGAPGAPGAMAAPVPGTPASAGATGATGAALGDRGAGAQPAPPRRLSEGGPGAQAPTQAASTATPPVRQGLPAGLAPLRISGVMYSEEARSRMLVVNDQLVHEGDRVAAGVVLERIGPKAARFRAQGQAFELGYGP